MTARPSRISDSSPGPHLYATHARAADVGSWSVERDVAWADIDKALAHRTPTVLAAIRDAAIIESFHPVNLGRFMRATWEDIDAGVCFSLEAFEGFKHFHVLRTYLEVVGYDPAITDAELVDVRRAGADREIESHELIEKLVEFMLSEHLASYFFRRLAGQAQEPVLQRLLTLIAADEVRHAQSASDLLAKHVRSDPSVRERILEAAVHFKHFGGEVVGDVPVAMPGDETAIQTFAKRIERLCGIRMVDHLKTKL
jgi:hypothetical protein